MSIQGNLVILHIVKREHAQSLFESKKLFKHKFMKKFYMNKIKTAALMAFALLANVAVGQNFTVTSNGNPVENGAIIALQYEFEDYSAPEHEVYTYAYAWYPNLKVASTDGEVNVTVTVTSINDTNNIQICWPMQCHFVAPGTSQTETGTIDTTPSDLQIHKEDYYYEQGGAPTQVGEAKVTILSDTQSFECTLKFLLEDINGVEENFVDENAPAEYFTIQGIRVAEPQKGQLYIERKGSKVVKRIF